MATKRSLIAALRIASVKFSFENFGCHPSVIRKQFSDAEIEDKIKMLTSGIEDPTDISSPQDLLKCFVILNFLCFCDQDTDCMDEVCDDLGGAWVETAKDIATKDLSHN